MSVLSLSSLKAGKRFTIDHPLSPEILDSSADAALIASLARAARDQRRCLVLICASAQDAQRLLGELALFAPGLRLALLPDWETLPYDAFSPHQDLISERLATLWAMQQRQLDVLLLSATSALYPLAPPAFLAAFTFHFRQAQALDAGALKSQLTLAGYEHVSNVIRPGEYAVRGGLIDIFPMGSSLPYRVDLFDQEIDSIRAFDPDSQRSLYPVPEVRLLPGREFPMDEAGRILFRQRWAERFEGSLSKHRPYKDMEQGVASPGIEYYLPLFFDASAPISRLFNYLDPDDAILLHGPVSQAVEKFWHETQDRAKLAGGDPERPILAPHELFLRPEDFFSAAKEWAQLALRPRSDGPADTPAASTPQEYEALPPVQVLRGAEDPLLALKTFLAQRGIPCAIVVESEGRRESIRDFLRASQLSPQDFDSLESFKTSGQSLGLLVGSLSNGFIWHRQQLALLTETELFASTSSVRRRKKQEQSSDLNTLIQDLSELNVGDPVVHSQHGIGRYRGLVSLDILNDGQAQEFLHLEYADAALLYVPISQLELISRYTGVSADEAPLHKLGSSHWDKAKRKAAQQVRDSAAELLNIYASRAAREGHAFRLPAQEYEVFAKDFGFEETPDQLAAIHAVVQDMVSPQPMDRLICGDVGFGKTEVALRAAFVAVMGGKQVAILAPTTLLAEQHYQTLVDRFAKWPVRIAEMSRFQSAKEIKLAAQGLANGTVDIVVGTHKLLSPEIQFSNLGLLIIDEEHRFGVRHKEAMKALRAQVDILTLTATPIPRTLGMALEGLRDLSVIATAPQRRLAIKTFVRSENNGVIREAVLRELKRGGQVYFLHNEVETIENRRSKLEQLLPEARIAVAHGQMPERELEAVMRNFVAQRSNILLCSTIIETGIDVPNANTILISRADKFGLAQLHQLRGRVGRSHHQAYAYLMVPDVQSLSKNAGQRLEAITQMEELGSGFFLAMHDLEIRGAGEVLGDKQSGNMMEIGFQLYNEMLAEAVRALKEGQEPDLLNLGQVQTDIKLHAPALLPNDYCGDVHLRLSYYKKMAMAKTLKQLDNLQEELADRFGKLPEPTRNLLHTHRIRIWGKKLKLLRCDARTESTLLVFAEDAPIDPTRIIHMIQNQPHIKLAGNAKLRIEKTMPNLELRVQMVRDVLRNLGADVAAS